jgi:glycosyltransferase involved in cell wall biosynthesis
MAPQSDSSDSPGVKIMRTEGTEGFQVSDTLGFLTGMTRARQSFNVLRAHDLGAPLGACVAYGAWKNLPVILHIHHIDRCRQPFHFIVQLYSSRIVYIITVSAFSKKQLYSILGYPRDRIMVVPCGVDTVYYSPGSRDHVHLSNTGKNPLRLLFVGSLLKRKNIPFLFQVVSILKWKRHNVVLKIVGSGPEEELLREHIRRHDLRESITLTGAVTDREKLNLYRECDIFLSASRMEGFGLSVAEAMSCGKPVVVAGGSALDELVEHGRTGLVASGTDAIQFSSQVELLGDNEYLRQSIGTEARASIVRRFNWDLTASRVADVCRHAAHRRVV